MTFADKVIDFNKNLEFRGRLPKGIKIMNPFKENEMALEASSKFYKKFYNDNKPRKLILGINPGRFGAGVTGVPFTDSKRLENECRIEIEGVSTHEMSSVFVYDFINAYGGVDQFYSDYYINSVCPLGFLIVDNKGHEKNYNYYDSKDLEKAVKPFIIKTLKEQIDFGMDRDVCYSLGSGKNFKYLKDLNKELNLFKKIQPLEHPRYIMQYKTKLKDEYIRKFIDILKH
jgi:hypothetical protein